MPGFSLNDFMDVFNSGTETFVSAEADQAYAVSNPTAFASSEISFLVQYSFFPIDLKRIFPRASV